MIRYLFVGGTLDDHWIGVPGDISPWYARNGYSAETYNRKIYFFPKLRLEMTVYVWNQWTDDDAIEHIMAKEYHLEEATQ